MPDLLQQNPGSKIQGSGGGDPKMGVFDGIISAKSAHWLKRPGGVAVVVVTVASTPCGVAVVVVMVIRLQGHVEASPRLILRPVV